MEKHFNTTGACFPEQHYMVDITERLAAIKKMIDCGDYFVINRGRQYGKTTTLNALETSVTLNILRFGAICVIMCEVYLFVASDGVRLEWILQK